MISDAYVSVMFYILNKKCSAGAFAWIQPPTYCTFSVGGHTEGEPQEQGREDVRLPARARGPALPGEGHGILLRGAAVSTATTYCGSMKVGVSCGRESELGHKLGNSGSANFRLSHMSPWLGSLVYLLVSKMTTF